MRIKVCLHYESGSNQIYPSRIRLACILTRPGLMRVWSMSTARIMLKAIARVPIVSVRLYSVLQPLRASQMHTYMVVLWLTYIRM